MGPLIASSPPRMCRAVPPAPGQNGPVEHHRPGVGPVAAQSGRARPVCWDCRQRVGRVAVDPVEDERPVVDGRPAAVIVRPGHRQRVRVFLCQRAGPAVMTLLKVRLPPVATAVPLRKVTSTLPLSVIGPATVLLPLELSSVPRLLFRPLPLSTMCLLNWFVADKWPASAPFSTVSVLRRITQAGRRRFDAQGAALNVNVAQRRIHRHAGNRNLIEAHLGQVVGAARRLTLKLAPLASLTVELRKSQRP